MLAQHFHGRSLAIQPLSNSPEHVMQEGFSIDAVPIGNANQAADIGSARASKGLRASEG